MNFSKEKGYNSLCFENLINDFIENMITEVKILGWWLLFGGSHILGSSLPIRTFIIRKLGTWGFKCIYSLVAILTFVPLCSVYFSERHAGPLLFVPNYGMQMATEVIMFFAIIILMQGLATSNPMTTRAELTGRFRSNPIGIQRVTRHPQNFSFALFGFAHLLSNPFVGDWLFFGGFIIYAIISAAHQDRRTLAIGPEESIEFQQKSSALPFRKIIAGKQIIALGEYNIPALFLSVGFFVFLKLYHAKIFGGFGA